MRILGAISCSHFAFLASRLINIPWRPPINFGAVQIISGRKDPRNRIENGAAKNEENKVWKGGMVRKDSTN